MKLLFTLLILRATVATALAAKIVLVAGGGTSPDGRPATKAKLIAPFGLDFDSQGRLYFVEMEKGERLRTIDPDGTIRTVAGTGTKTSNIARGPANTATFNGMHGIAIGANDWITLADTWNNCVRAYDPELKIVAPVVGTGVKGFAGDGLGHSHAVFGGVFAVCFDTSKANLYIADLDNRRIRRLDVKSQIVTTVAGNGTKGTPQDGGTAIDEPLLDPRACAVDADGNLYILERNGHCLRVVSKDGTIKTVMGTGKAGLAVGNALASQMNGPKHLCVDRDKTVIIADSENHRILRYDPKTRLVTVLAGTGKKGTAGLDGDPLQCQLNRPHGVTVHPKSGELHICDSYNDRILKITP